MSIGFLACSGTDKEKDNTVLEYEHQSDKVRIEKVSSNETDEPHSDAGLVVSDDIQEPSTVMAQVTVSSLNIRKAPSLDSEVITTVKQGAVFQCLEQGNEWHKIMYEGEEAYVYASYVKINENSSSGQGNENGNTVNSGENEDYSLDHLKIVEITDQYTYDVMCADIEKLTEEYSAHMSAKPIATSADSRFIYDIIIGKSNASKQVMIYAGIHGSESITSLLAMKQIENYLYNYEKYSDFFEDTAIHVFPMVNPDGITLSQLGDDGINNQEYRDSVRRWYFRDIAMQVNTLGKPDYYSGWNANLKGVDIYYNFPYKWEEFKGSIVPGTKLYKGSFALSEEESNALYKQIKKIVPTAVIGYHLSDGKILWDFGQTGDIYGQSKALCDKLKTITGYEEASSEEVSGSFDAWVVHEWNIPAVALKIKTDDGSKATEEFEKIWKDNRDLWEVFN